jgi:hypothetical protein
MEGEDSVWGEGTYEVGMRKLECLMVAKSTVYDQQHFSSFWGTAWPLGWNTGGTDQISIFLPFSLQANMVEFNQANCTYDVTPPYHPHHQRYSQNRFFLAIAVLGIFFQIFPVLGFCKCNFLYRTRSTSLHQTPNLEGQVSVFMSLSDSVIHLHPEAPGSLFFTF